MVGWPGENSVANQDYCRLWARLVHMDAFGHREWHDPVAAGLDYLSMSEIISVTTIVKYLMFTIHENRGSVTEEIQNAWCRI